MAEERHICALRRQGCGGCPLLETPYPEQLRQKQARVEALLGEFGPVSPILGMEHPWHYRNKAISTFCTGPGRRLDSGIYAAGTHRVVPVASCLLHHPALDEAVEAVRRAARLCRYEPYQEDRGTGLVRHVLVRHSRATGRVLVALVTAAPVLPGARAFVSKVRELCPQVETIVQNINPRRSSAVLGPREKVLWGRGYIEDTLCGVRFRLGASSFYQINPEQTEVLYRTALDGAGLDGTQTVVDAYCGVGTIGLAAAIIQKLTPLTLIPGINPISEGVAIVGDIAVVLAGAFPLVYVITRVFKTPLMKLGHVLGMNDIAAAGLVATLANNIPMFQMLHDMDRRGKIINVAFAVSAAFVFGDHLGFTAGFDSTMIFPMIVGKLVGGVTAVAVAMLITRKYKEERHG